jgi:hypothetical protein
MSEQLFQQSVVERDKRADVMVRFLDVAKNIEAFHGKKMEEIFKEEITKRNFLESLNAEEFEGLISGVNGILRKKEKKDWGMDGGAVANSPYPTPYAMTQQRTITIFIVMPFLL